ncbi:carbonic anhydrase 4 [Macrotis lagotis]|uniref:carbonic anhydrase 4 n=1 Tax=Macrotis lagotis TaxID=92651 RepID=UPI003D683539
MISFLILLALTLAQPVAPEPWCYASLAEKIECLGPDKWLGNCQNKHQSPININTKAVIYNYSMPPFQFSNYDKKEEWRITNNGHTVEVKLNNSIKISGGGLKETYKAVGIHLHWSDSLNKGSEHTIDGNSYPMEMHIVHIKDKYNALSEALEGNDIDEIAVLGFLVKAAASKNEYFDILVKSLSSIPHKSDSVMLEKLNIFEIIPQVHKLKNYYRYWGSLTTPNCDEKVIWTVFRDPIEVHKDQILEFSKRLFYEEKMLMIDNYRKTYPLEDRQVFFASRVGILLPYDWPTLLVPLLTYLLAVLLY